MEVQAGAQMTTMRLQLVLERQTKGLLEVKQKGAAVNTQPGAVAVREALGEPR
jgi:hypothetical protein